MKNQNNVYSLLQQFGLLIAFCLCLPSFGAPINLIQNGSFASGLTGWTLSGHGGIGFAYNGGADGGAYVILDSLALSPLSQNVTATPGQSYALTFAFRGSYPAMQSPPFGINVFWNAQEVGNYTLNVYSTSWVTESLTVIGGPGSVDQLTFVNPDPTYSALDTVSMVSVPETADPSIYVLAALAVIGCSFLSRPDKSPNLY